VGLDGVTEELLVPSNLDIERVLEELSSVGATSVRLLEEGFRVALLKEAQDYDYQPEDEVVGSGDRVVKQ
jgi:hypothetical protein